MNIPKEKFDRVREQVIAKIRWGTADDEVLEWLSEKWAISGTMADGLLAEAHRLKRQAVRGKAVQVLAISGVCLLLVAIYLGVQQSKKTLSLSGLTIVVLIVGVVSLIALIKSLLQVMRGEGEGPAD
jgi:hypothetical protein